MEFAECQRLFEGKKVALVGNAQSIFGKGQGQKIDACDVVMRFNFGLIKEPRDQGSRTDVLGTSDRKIDWDYVTTGFAPKLVIWLTPKPLGEHLALPNAIPLFRTPEPVAEELMHRVAPDRPSSGLIAAHLIVNHFKAASVELYGFDFFKTATFYHGFRWRFWRRRKIVHNGSSEARVIAELGCKVF